MDSKYLKKIIAEEFEKIMQEDTDGIAADKSESMSEAENVDESWASFLGWIKTAVAGISVMAGGGPQLPADQHDTGQAYVFKAHDKKGEEATIKVDKSELPPGVEDEADAYKYVKDNMYKFDKSKDLVGLQLDDVKPAYFIISYTKDGVQHTRGFENDKHFELTSFKDAAKGHFHSKVKLKSATKEQADQATSEDDAKVTQQRTSDTTAASFRIENAIESGGTDPRAVIEIDINKLPQADQDAIYGRKGGGDAMQVVQRIARREVASYSTPKSGTKFEMQSQDAVRYQIKDGKVLMNVKVKPIKKAEVKENKKINKLMLREMVEECMADMANSGQMQGLSVKMPGAHASNIDPDGYEGEMAKGNLYNAAKAAMSLHNLFNDNENLEPWVEEKIAVASNMIKTVADYVEYQKMKG